jgi:hypothetical protein
MRRVMARRGSAWFGLAGPGWAGLASAWQGFYRMEMIVPFEVAGEQPQWLTVYEFLGRLQPQINDTVTFEEFEEACGLDVRKNRSPWYKAANLWCRENHRAFVPVVGVGYRVARATEHEILARKQHRKSRRSLRKGLQVIRNTDHSELSPADRARFQRIESEMSRQSDAIRRLDLRQDRMQQALEEGRRAQEAVRREQEQLRATVDRLEHTLRHHGLDEGQPG